MTQRKSWNHKYIGLLVILLCCIHHTSAAFTVSTEDGGDVILQDAAGTWCFYPKVRRVTDISCKGDFTTVSVVHLNTTTSIGYYAPDNTRYGGPEFPIASAGITRVTLCVSGRAPDGTYRTQCAHVSKDNTLFQSSDCMINVGQSVVTDGCYEPGQPPSNTITKPGATGSATSPGAGASPTSSNAAPQRLGVPSKDLTIFVSEFTFQPEESQVQYFQRPLWLLPSQP